MLSRAVEPVIKLYILDLYSNPVIKLFIHRLYEIALVLSSVCMNVPINKTKIYYDSLKKVIW
jgi:hypothetical protein